MHFVEISNADVRTVNGVLEFMSAAFRQQWGAFLDQVCSPGSASSKPAPHA